MVNDEHVNRRKAIGISGLTQIAATAILATRAISDSSSGEEETHAKHPRKPAKKWEEVSKLVLKAIKVFDNLNVGIQVLHI